MNVLNFAIRSMESVPVITCEATADVVWYDATHNNVCLCTLTNISLHFLALITSTQIGVSYNNMLWTMLHSTCSLILGINLAKLVSLVNDFLVANLVWRPRFLVKNNVEALYKSHGSNIHRLQGKR